MSDIDSFVPTRKDLDSLINSIAEYNKFDTIPIEILIESGLRISEVTHFFHTFDKRKVEIHDDVIVYPLFYLRKKKNSYYLFMSTSLYKRFLEFQFEFKKYTFERLRTHIKRKNY